MNEQAQMKTSETIKEIVCALIPIQTHMHVNKDGANPHFKSKFATLDNILETIKPILEGAGIVTLQSIISEGRKLECTTRIFHESGEWIESTVAVEADKGSPQGFGSAITYARRYGIASALGIGLMDDDDGNKAEEKTTKADAKAEADKKLAKTKGAWFGPMLEMDIEVVHASFEASGFVTDLDDPEEALRDLFSQVDTLEKLTAIKNLIKSHTE